MDGSFTENKELLLLEPPNDVDIVTFFHLPDGMDQSSFAQVFADLFDTDNTKKLYKVDAYGQPLGVALKEMDVVIISYWQSMWSHTRNRIWKGFLQVDFSEDEDHIASGLLARMEVEFSR